MALLNEIDFMKIVKIKDNEQEYESIIVQNLNINRLLFSRSFFINIEYLSFRTNNFQDLSFLSYFPKLWHLDIRDNPVI